MDITIVEVAAVESVVTKEEQTQVRELTELQLLLVGGGMGDVNFG